MRYAKWDEVILIVDDKFGYKDKVTSHLKVMILGFDTDYDSDYAQYLCYVPAYEKIPYGFPTFTIDKHHIKHFNVEPRFLGDAGCFITTRFEIYKHIVAPKGDNCDHCKTWFNDAVRNDKGAYMCRACAADPYR